MGIDVIVLLSFVACGLWPERWFFWPLSLVVSFILEVFSTLPFGYMTLILFVSIGILRFMLRLFDASSYFTFLLAFVTAIFIYSIGVIAGFQYEIGFSMRELSMRGVLFFSREILLALFLGLTILGVRFSRRLYSYAFLEEKITI